MAWVRIDDGFTQHPKVAQAGPLGIAMQIAGLCYCNRYLTDGFIPRAVVPGLLNLEGIAMRVWGAELFGGEEDATWRLVVSDLISAGLWEEVEGGYRIHDYLDYQPSRAEVLKEREIAKRRNAMNCNPNLTKAVRQRDGDLCRYCGVRVNWRDRKSPQGGTYDHVVPVSEGGDESADNIVVCCRLCNTKKGARTPEEAGMTLLPPPNILDGIKTESERNLDDTQTSSRHPNPNPDPDPDPKESTQECTPGELDARWCGEGMGEPTPPPSPDATPTELAILHELKGVADYPFDYTKDLDFIRSLAVDFADLDVLDEVKKWATYKRDRPLKKSSNPRLQFRNWLSCARRYAKERRLGVERGRDGFGNRQGDAGHSEATRRPTASDYTSGRYGRFFARSEPNAPG